VFDPISKGPLVANSERLGCVCVCVEPISYLDVESASGGSLEPGDVELLFLMSSLYRRKQRKIPNSAASPTIGITTINAIRTLPRCPLNHPPPETLATAVLEPRPVEFFGDGGEVLVDEDPLVVDNEPEVCGAGELVPPATGVLEPRPVELC
jgi:hypothetical protein